MFGSVKKGINLWFKETILLFCYNLRINQSLLYLRYETYLDMCVYCRHLAAWYPVSTIHGTSSDVIVYSVHAVIISMETMNSRQRFFIGHTEKVTSIAFNSFQRKFFSEKIHDLRESRLTSVHSQSQPFLWQHALS